MILILALDGLDPDVMARLGARGELPRLAALAREGLEGRLRSTFPPVSVPAWSTFLTGVGPGVHGLLDFTRLEAGRVRFQNAADREVPTFLELADAANRRCCAIGLPTTYPVSPLRHGAMLSGFDSPFSGDPDASAMHPARLWEDLRRGGLDLRPSGLPEGRKGRGWHRRAASEILASVERRTAQALALLERGAWDLLAVHFQAADTAGHHFFRYFDAASPRHDASWPERGQVLTQVYRALDRAVGILCDAAESRSGPALRVIISDHGMGAATDRVIHLNRWLEQQGWLVRRPRRRGVTQLAGAARALALAWLPRELQAVLFRRLRGGFAAGVETALRLGEIDLERSAAFSEESSTLPGVWLLDPARADEVTRRLRAWDAVRRVYRREDVYRGPARRRAPHLLLELRHGLVRTPPGYAGPACRRLSTRELDGTRGAGLNGEHRRDGVLIAAGPGVSAGEAPSGAWIGDLAPSLLAALGVPAPDWMEGRCLPGLTPARGGASAEAPGRPPPSPPPPRPRSDAHPRRGATARLERRLRALGYLG